jgi:hypothetical protein
MTADVPKSVLISLPVADQLISPKLTRYMRGKPES